MAGDRRLRILLVDDEPDILLLLQAMLTAPTWEIVGKAAGGEDALRIAAHLQPDVAVVDYMMPGMHGLEVAEQLKQVLPACEVVLFSAYNVQDEADVSPHVDHFLAKTDVSTLEVLLDRMAKRLGVEG